MAGTGQRVMVVKSGGPSAVPEWREHFRVLLPDTELRCWTEPGNLADIGYALVWEPDEGRLAAMPNLRLILSSAVGVEHILADRMLPRHLPILRTVPGEAADQMAEYVAWAVLHLHRGIPLLQEQQARGHWQFHDPPLASARRVGILGLGSMGARCARMLAGIGFRVSGWSRGRKAIADVACHAGQGELPRFLADLDIVVCLLPATPETRGILGTENLARLPRGACLVSAGRGQQVPERDLLAALDAGQLSRAVLDVFENEPLPAESPLWRDPRIIVTPHVASLPSREARARFIADAIRRFEQGEVLPTLYDPALGY